MPGWFYKLGSFLRVSAFRVAPDFGNSQITFGGVALECREPGPPAKLALRMEGLWPAPTRKISPSSSIHTSHGPGRSRKGEMEKG